MTADPRHWTLTTDDQGIAWLGLDRQGATANTLGGEVLIELNDRLEEIERASPRGVVVWSAKPSGFVAGADISEFGRLETEEQAYRLVSEAHRVFARLEALTCPTVAAIHGFVLGGGLELALACRYRVAANDGKLSVGLPEVMLGIHPGFGGTVRTPRVAGARTALDLMLTGRSLRAEKALATGLVDRLVPPDQLHDAARQILRELPAQRRAPLVDRLMSMSIARPFVARKMATMVARRARREHYPAPYAIIDLWRTHGARGAAAFDAEARSIARLFMTDTSRNLVRVFYLQERLKGLGGRSPREFRHVHVVGAGVMGGDIAAWCAWRGLTVTVQDRAEDYVARALGRAREFFGRRARTPAQAAECAARLTADVAGEGVARADVVIEAIFEDAAAKRALYAVLEPLMKPDALLATNTSSIMLEELSRDLADPGRLVGLHFFNPVAKMMLVEVIHGRGTRPEVDQAALAFTRRLDKLPLPCASSPGFAVNRVLSPYMAEAMFAVAEGVPPTLIDRVATDFGMPMGPIELVDTVGLDVAVHVGRILAEASGREAPTGVRELVAAGRLGRKSGEGYYRWVDGKPVRPSADGAAPPADLEDRLVLAFLNEAVACLREGVVTDADLLDAGIIFGTGFAPFRGGPLHYARHRGPDAIAARLRELEHKYGARFRADPGWETLPQLRS